MQRFMATPHNALSVRKRPLSRKPESSYKLLQCKSKQDPAQWELTSYMIAPI